MTDHGLTRDPGNYTACTCGYRPALHDNTQPAGSQWRAKTAVLDHIDYMKGRPETPRPETARRSPDAPFQAKAEPKYPRAGVRLLPSGRWLLSLWDGAEILHVIDEPEFPDRMTAFEYAWMTIGACRRSGTSLSGSEAP